MDGNHIAQAQVHYHTPAALDADTPSRPKALAYLFPNSRFLPSRAAQSTPIKPRYSPLPAHRRKPRLLPRVVDISSVHVEYTGYRPGEEGQREAYDNTKARRELGYEPKASAEETVKLTAEWVKSLVRAG